MNDGDSTVEGEEQQQQQQVTIQEKQCANLDRMYGVGKSNREFEVTILLRMIKLRFLPFFFFFSALCRKPANGKQENQSKSSWRQASAYGASCKAPTAHSLVLFCLQRHERLAFRIHGRILSSVSRHVYPGLMARKHSIGNSSLW